MARPLLTNQRLGGRTEVRAARPPYAGLNLVAGVTARRGEFPDGRHVPPSTPFPPPQATAHEQRTPLRRSRPPGKKDDTKSTVCPGGEGGGRRRRKQCHRTMLTGQERRARRSQPAWQPKNSSGTTINTSPANYRRSSRVITTDKAEYYDQLTGLPPALGTPRPGAPMACPSRPHRWAHCHILAITCYHNPV